MSLVLPDITAFIGSGVTEAQYKTALTQLHAIVGQLFAGYAGATSGFMNPSKIEADWGIPSGYNAVSAGPIEIAEGVTVTINDHATWSIT